MSRTLLFFAVGLMSGQAWSRTANRDELVTLQHWAEVKMGGEPSSKEAGLFVLANHDPVQKDGRFGKPLRLGASECAQGLYCHAQSEILVRLPGPGARFEAAAGVDSNEDTSKGSGSVQFLVRVNGKEAFASEVLRGGQPATPVGVDLKGAQEFTLAVNDAGDGISCDQADWADAKVTLQNGESIWLSDLPMPQTPVMEDAEIPPFSFTYGGAPSGDLLKRWKLQRSVEDIDPNRSRITLTYTDAESLVEVRCVVVQYRDFPIVEWTLYLRNGGQSDSLIFENVLPLDLRMERGDRGEFLLHHAVGSPCQINDYEPLTSRLEANTTRKIGGAGGRATSSDLCYFNVESTCGDGLIIGLGWPGQWSAEFRRDGGKILSIRAGQELTYFKLLPGEEVRTPLVAIQFWKGEWVRSQNIWRRWMISHNLPRPGGEAIAPFVTADSSAQFGEMIGADEKSQIYFIDRYVEERLGIDTWWMDAGWYVCDGSWPKTGTWEVDLARFPAGLRAITDHAHAKKLKIIVWFEPERVAAGTWLAENHPDWILGGRNGGLLYLGNPEARQWLTDHVDKVLREQGIDWYRQDFNFDPLDLWRSNDEPDRQGITEIKHIMGLFEYWDELVRRRDGRLLIDTCASGGRRNDLETLRRAVPLWRTDFPFQPTATQCHTYGISLWIPFSGTGVKVIDNYDFRSNAAPEFTCHWDVRDPSLNYDLLRQQLADWRQYAPNFMGDYYPLTPYSSGEDAWMAWQFDRPELGQGMVQVFRRAESPYTAASFRLAGLDPSRSYRVTDMDTRSSRVIPGPVLMDQGLEVSMSKKPGASVLLYEKE